MIDSIHYLHEDGCNVQPYSAAMGEPQRSVATAIGEDER